MQHLASSDPDRLVQATIRANFKPEALHHDVEAHLDALQRCHTPECHVLAAGSPCQSFAPEGNRRGLKDPRGQVTLRILELRDKLEPRLVLLEHSPGMRKTNNGKDWRKIRKLLTKGGLYRVYEKVLNTCDHGVPQNRSRLYIVLIHREDDRGTFVWPEAIPQPSIEDFLDPATAEDDATRVPPPSQRQRRAALETFKEKLERPLEDACILCL